MALKQKAPEAVADINVTPMVDVMLVLLIIFMVITPMLQKGVTVDMARARNTRNMQGADKSDAVLLAVTRDGKYYLKSDPIALNQVTSTVKDRLANKLDKTVYIKSDRRARYGDVEKLVDAVRAAGVDSLGLLTEKIESSTKAGPGGAAPAPAQVTP